MIILLISIMIIILFKVYAIYNEYQRQKIIKNTPKKALQVKEDTYLKWLQKKEY